MLHTRHALPLVLGVSLILPTALQATPRDVQLLQQFGLEGQWAVNCRQPPTERIGWVVLRLMPTTAMAGVTNGTGVRASGLINKVTLLSATDIRFDYFSQELANTFTFVIRKIEEGRVQIWGARDARHGELAREGKDIESGEMMPVLQHCE
jgi:hypothetical protein